jgi:hypothetical protein
VWLSPVTRLAIMKISFGPRLLATMADCSRSSVSRQPVSVQPIAGLVRALLLSTQWHHFLDMKLFRGHYCT